MPELPEVETMRRSLLGVEGGTIRAVVKLDCPRKPIGISPRIDHLSKQAVGKQVLSVDRVGKRVALRLEDQSRLLFEPRMTGLMVTGDSPDPLYLRMRVDFDSAKLERCWYWDRRGLGLVYLLGESEFAEAFSLAKLGPDGLVVTAEDFRERIGRSRREVKPALLDQRAVAGIGNIYAAEILHLAGVHPATRCDRISLRRWQAIADATHEVLQTAIRYEGSSLGDGTYRNKLNQDGSYQLHHQVYGRAGESCSRCDGVVKQIVQTQRSTFFCAGCQKKR